MPLQLISAIPYGTAQVSPFIIAEICICVFASISLASVILIFWIFRFPRRRWRFVLWHSNNPSYLFDNWGVILCSMKRYCHIIFIYYYFLYVLAQVHLYFRIVRLNQVLFKSLCYFLNVVFINYISIGRILF